MEINLIEKLAPYLEQLVIILDVFAILIILWGAWLAIKDFLYFSFTERRIKAERINQNNAIKKNVRWLYLVEFRSPDLSWYH